MAAGVPGRAKRAMPPGFIEPLLPILVDAVPVGDEWIHEIKYDGYRTELVIGDGQVRAFTRRGFDWTERYHIIADCAAALLCRDAVIDGEVIMQDVAGRSDYHALRARIGASGEGLIFMAFDLLRLDGQDMRARPVEARRAALEHMLGANDPSRPIQFSQHVRGSGAEFLAAVEAMGLEGIISKRLGSRYRSGPSRAWLKIKCFYEEELVVIGTSTGDLAPRALLAREEAGALVYAGPAMVTLPDPERELFWRTAERLRIAEPAIAMARRKETGWVKPWMRVRVRALRGEDMLRHATLKAIVAIDEPASAPRPRSPRVRTAAEPTYPKPDFSPAAVTEYYEQLGALLLPWVSDRPLNLFRCPDDHCLFQRHERHPIVADGTFGAALHRLALQQKNGKVERYFHLDDMAGVRAALAGDTIEFHGWGSRIGDVERSDRIVIDLDPDEDLPFASVRQAAYDLRARFAELGLTSFPLLTGGKGIHVVAPLTPDAEWPQVRDFARSLCSDLAEEAPDRYTIALQKVRRRGRIFLDFLRNQRTATAVLPYSLRARAGLPVAAPVGWEELGEFAGADAFRAADAALLVRRSRRAMLRGWGRAAQTLPMWKGRPV